MGIYYKDKFGNDEPTQFKQLNDLKIPNHRRMNNKEILKFIHMQPEWAQELWSD